MNDIDYNNLNPYNYNGDDPLHYETAFPGHPNESFQIQDGSNNTCGTQAGPKSFTDPISSTSLYPGTVPSYDSLRLTSLASFMTSIAGDLQPQTPACPYPYTYGMQNSASMSGQVPTMAIREPGYGINISMSAEGPARAEVDYNVRGVQETALAKGTAKAYYVSEHSHQKKLATERKRRKALCSAYEELRSVLPPAAQRGFKYDVMAAAAEEIRRLRAEVQQCKQSGSCPHHL